MPVQTEFQTKTYTQKSEITKVLVLAVALFFVLWLRRPGSLLNAQFWAEDGGDFFREQLIFGFRGAILRPYSGYLHTIPRVITGLMCVFPVRWIPLGFSICALVIQSLVCSTFFWPCYRKIIASDSLRAVCCFAMAASFATDELVATVCNLQWYLCILSLLLLVATDDDCLDTGKEIWLAIVQVFIALSAPGTLLYIPMLLWQLKNKPARLKTRPAIHLTALFLQAWVMHRDVSGAKPPLHFNSIFVAMLSSGLSRCVLGPLIGMGFLKVDSDIALVVKLSVALFGGAVVVTLLAVKLYGTPRMKWLLSAAYVALGVLFAALWGRGMESHFLTMDGVRTTQGERYFFDAACLFIFCLALAVETLIRWPKPYFSAVALAAILALGTGRNFVVKPFIDMHWQKGAAQIEEWEARKKRGENGPPVFLPLNPNLTLTLN